MLTNSNLNFVRPLATVLVTCKWEATLTWQCCNSALRLVKRRRMSKHIKTFACKFQRQFIKNRRRCVRERVVCTHHIAVLLYSGHTANNSMGESWQTDNTDRQTNGQTDRQTTGQTNNWTVRQTDKQLDSQTDRQTTGQTDKWNHRETWYIYTTS